MQDQTESERKANSLQLIKSNKVKKSYKFFN